MIVLDASAALAWAYSDETGWPDQVMEAVGVGSAVVPCHWILEVTNSLLIGERRGRIDAEQHSEILARVKVLPIQTDPLAAAVGWQFIPALAKRHRLTTYDAAYLELALRLGTPLATLDQDLARAARKAGVPLFA